jgi:hypothetical protein
LQLKQSTIQPQQKVKTKNMTTQSTKIRSAGRHFRLGFFLIPLVVACFALSPQARAVCQDGCDINLASTFLGDDALVNNLTGTSNTAIGSVALTANTGGAANTAIGSAALFNNNGTGNTATGTLALRDNTTGNSNTATGFDALVSNTTGGYNTATGDSALFNNAIGSYNIAVGVSAGDNLTTGSYNIDIGSRGRAGEFNTIRIGTAGTQTNAYVAGIIGATVPTGVAVIVDNKGHLGTTTSSERYKEAVNPMDKASEAILSLKPVTFRYKKELDPEGIPQFGLVAEQVEKVNRDLVARDEDGKPYTVRYEAVNAMLLNEFLKEHRKVERLEATLRAVNARLAEQDAKIQKVSAQLELNKPALRAVAKNQ